MTDGATEKEPEGLICRKCGCPDLRVIRTRRRNIRRVSEIMRRIMRRRECKNCGARFTTWETFTQ